MAVNCRLMKEGAVLEEVEIPLAANGQEQPHLHHAAGGAGPEMTSRE